MNFGLKVAEIVENSCFFLMPKICRIAFGTMSMPKEAERPNDPEGDAESVYGYCLPAVPVSHLCD